MLSINDAYSQLVNCADGGLLKHKSGRGYQDNLPEIFTNDVAWTLTLSVDVPSMVCSDGASEASAASSTEKKNTS